MATSNPAGDFRLLEMMQQAAINQRAQRYGDDGIAYEPEREEAVNFSQVDWSTFRPIADGEQHIQPATITTTGSSGEAVGMTPWQTTTNAPQWVEVTTGDSTVPLPRPRSQRYRMRPDGTLEIVEDEESAINPVIPQPIYPNPFLIDETVAVDQRNRELAEKVDELTETVKQLQIALKRLEQQQPDVEKDGVKLHKRKLIV